MEGWVGREDEERGEERKGDGRGGERRCRVPGEGKAIQLAIFKCARVMGTSTIYRTHLN